MHGARHPQDLTTAPHELSVYEDARGRAQVEGLKRVEVTTEAQALALFFEVCVLCSRAAGCLLEWAVCIGRR